VTDAELLLDVLGRKRRYGSRGDILEVTA